MHVLASIYLSITINTSNNVLCPQRNGVWIESTLFLFQRFFSLCFYLHVKQNRSHEYKSLKQSVVNRSDLWNLLLIKQKLCDQKWNQNYFKAVEKMSEIWKQSGLLSFAIIFHELNCFEDLNRLVCVIATFYSIHQNKSSQFQKKIAWSSHWLH